MNNIYKISFLIIVFLVNLAFADGQENKLILSKFDLKSGLSLNSVNCMLVDHKGFLWVGTQDGLNKYDGYSFRVYRHDPNDSISIVSNDILTIFEDKKFNIWVGTREGLSKLNRETDVFSNFTNDEKNPTSLVNNEILGICQDENEKMWIKTTKHLSLFDVETGIFRSFEHNSDIFKYASATNYIKLVVDKKGLIWMPTKDGLFFYNKDNFQFMQFLYDEKNIHSISDNEILSVYKTSEGEIYVGTSNGLNLYNRKLRNFQRYYVEPNKLEASWNSISAITEISKDKLIMSTEKGIVIFDKNKKEFELQSPISLELNKQKITKITAILKDSSDIVWLGSGESGLYKFDLKKKKFNLLQNSDHSVAGLPSSDIASIYLDENNQLWLGTWGAGLSIFNRQTKKVITYNTTSTTNKLSNNYIHVIYKDNENKVWLGTRNGPSYYDAKSKKFIELVNNSEIKNNQVFKNNRVYSILEDKRKILWICTELGLIKLENNVANLVRIPFLGVRNNQTYNTTAIIEDKDGVLWVGSSLGLVQFISTTNKFKFFSKSTPTKKGLSSNTIWSICEGKNDVIWIGTQSGLNKFEKRTSTFEYYTQSEGFKNDYIYAMIEATDGKLWVSTNRGLVKFDPEIKKATNFDLDDGLQNYEYNVGACYKSANQEFFFGGVSGVNSFFPDSVFQNPKPPKLSFTSIQITHKSGLGKKEYLDNIEDLEISQNDYMVTIEFSALDLSSPSRNQFRYKLVNESDENPDWTPLLNQHYITLSRPAPGDYTLYVQGANSDGVWSIEILKLKVSVKPPFYSSKKAYALYFFIFILSLLIILKIYSRNQRKTILSLKEKEKASQEVIFQKEELSHKNASITDSLHYAQRIIQAMLPSLKLFEKLIPNSLLLYLPKDIVSGDFYWFGERNNKVFVAVVDCTGHGIPGAFMSIIGLDLIRNITKKQGVEDPAEILNRLNTGVADTFRDADGTIVNDGMDLAICAFDLKNNVIEYAGAFNPIYIVRNNTIIEYKGNRFAVGLASEQNKQIFTKHIIPLEKNDIIYMFSDGYVDQFGGPKGKKFKSRRFGHLLLTIAHLPMTTQKEILTNTINAWRGNLEQVDDILIVGIKYPFSDKQLNAHISKSKTQ